MLRTLVIAIATLLSGEMLLLEQTFADQALDIAQRAYDRDDGKDSWAETEMILVEEDGTEKIRQLRVATKDFGELSKRFTRFVSPAAIDGTTFLAIEKHEERDEQFLFLPSLGRVRRIAADQKDRQFVNSDLTYEDLERRKVERDSFKLLGSEAVLGKDCWILERKSKDPDDSQYGRSVSWIDKDSLLALKVKMFDKSGEKEIKTVEAVKIEKIDQIWTVMHAVINDLRSNHKTINKISKIKYNSGVSDDVFTQQYMENGG